MTPDQLRSEIASGPLAAALAPLVARGDHTGIARMLNDRAGPGASTIALAAVPRDDFLASLLPAYLALGAYESSGDPGRVATAKRWDRILGVIESADPVKISPDLMAAAVADGLLTQGQADAAWHRTGSRVEQLDGPGAAIDHTHVGRALAPPPEA